MKKYKLLMVLMALLTISGCERVPIDKQEADDIVIKYIKKNFSSDDYTERSVWYYNELEEDWIEMAFIHGEENIVAENAFVYYIDENFNDMFRHPHRIILVQKKNGKYTVYHRSVSPRVLDINGWAVLNKWSLLYMFANGEFWK